MREPHLRVAAIAELWLTACANGKAPVAKLEPLAGRRVAVRINAKL
jgi:hypothetical protein